MSTATRPDQAAAAVGVLCQYMSRLSKDHWISDKRVLRSDNLKGTLKYGHQFSPGKEGEPELVGYSDADWAGDVDTRKSTSGYAFHIAKSTISWSRRKQSTVAKSSTQAQYVGLSSAAQEPKWLRRLLKDFGAQRMPQPQSMKTTKAQELLSGTGCICQGVPNVYLFVDVLPRGLIWTVVNRKAPALDLCCSHSTPVLC